MVGVVHGILIYTIRRSCDGSCTIQDLYVIDSDTKKTRFGDMITLQFTIPSFNGENPELKL